MGKRGKNTCFLVGEVRQWTVAVHDVGPVGCEAKSISTASLSSSPYQVHDATSHQATWSQR